MIDRVEILPKDNVSLTAAPSKPRSRRTRQRLDASFVLVDGWQTQYAPEDTVPRYVDPPEKRPGLYRNRKARRMRSKGQRGRSDMDALLMRTELLWLPEDRGWSRNERKRRRQLARKQASRRAKL